MERIQKLIELTRPYYLKNDDPSHDWPHVGRVASSARALAKTEAVNVECMLASVYCHDLINLPKDHPERKEASTLSAKEALPLLKASGFTEEEIKTITQAVIEHSFSKGLKPSSKEAALLQDADRLDALGAIGILRCASVNTIMKSKYYDPFDPFAASREFDDKKFMVDHYSVKLFKLPELMNTHAGRIEGEKRVVMMKGFLQQLKEEIGHGL
jgi:uncharacterized protein